jgi:GT2 family glycosyltransferase
MVSACFLFNRKVWDGKLQFDESLGFNLEDHDFGVRAQLAGYTLWIQPEAIVRHGSGTPGLSYRPGDTPSEARVFYLTVNRWIIIGKCYSLRTIVLLSPALLAYEAIQLAWLTGEGHLGVWWRAVTSLVRRRRTLIAERRVIQRQRRLGDAGILRDVPLPIAPHVREHPLGRRLAPLIERVFSTYWRVVRRCIED